MKFLEKKSFLIIVTMLGLAGVGISYFLSFNQMPNGFNDLWGNTPEYAKPFYFITTSLAFLGFALAFCFLIFKTDLFNYYPISRSVIVILVASMLWLPYTAQMVQEPTSFTWVKIRIALLLVGCGSWFFMRRIWLMKASEHHLWYKMALAGSFIFFFHTMVMDAILWPFWFR